MSNILKNLSGFVDAAQKDVVSSAGSVSNHHLKSQALEAQRQLRSSEELLSVFVLVCYKIVMCSVGESYF